MSGNTFGKILKLTTFGESHGKAIGGVLDGLPSNIEINFDLIEKQLQKRSTGKFFFESSRQENDAVEFLSGIYKGRTLGSPIAFVINNNDAINKDYSKLENVFRPSHADYTYHIKYGVRDYRGGGRASARETIARVIGGTIAKMYLDSLNIQIFAYVSQIGKYKSQVPHDEINTEKDILPPLYFPDALQYDGILKYLEEIATDGDTIGGRITCIVKNVPAGIGEPVFEKLQAQLAHAMMGINAVKGFEYGSGFSAASMKGSEHNDKFFADGHNNIRTETNYSGGIQGGISNGEDIYFSVAFKPVASIKMKQKTVDVNGIENEITIDGRHDVCPVPRAIPIIEAMTALVIADNILLNKRLK